jgi:hypothetical protein
MLSVLQMGGGGMSGLINGNSKTLGLDNLGSEVAGGTCGTPEKGSVN